MRCTVSGGSHGARRKQLHTDTPCTIEKMAIQNGMENRKLIGLLISKKCCGISPQNVRQLAENISKKAQHYANTRNNQMKGWRKGSGDGGVDGGNNDSEISLTVQCSYFIILSGKIKCTLS